MSPHECTFPSDKLVASKRINDELVPNAKQFSRSQLVQRANHLGISSDFKAARNNIGSLALLP